MKAVSADSLASIRGGFVLAVGDRELAEGSKSVRRRGAGSS